MIIIFKKTLPFAIRFHLNRADKHNEPKMPELDTKTDHDKLPHLSTEKDTFMKTLS